MKFPVRICGHEFQDEEEFKLAIECGLSVFVNRMIERENGENKVCMEAIAFAIEEHYLPKNSTDPRLPQNRLGAVTALADRIDNIVGRFSLGKISTSKGDPYGLRRDAIAIWRIVVETRDIFKDVVLEEIIKESIKSYQLQGFLKDIDENILIKKIMDFFYDKVRSYLCKL